MAIRLSKRVALVAATTAVLVGLGSSVSALSTAQYYGLFAIKDNTILAELDCTSSTSQVSSCDARTTNTTARVFDSPSGDLHRVKGKFQDRNDNGKPSYVHIDWYSSGSFCVSGDIAVGGGSATGGVGASVCSGWISADDVRSTMDGVAKAASTNHTHSTALVSFTGEHVRNVAQNSSRANVLVCEDNVLFYTDTCSGNRILTVDFG